MAVRKMFVCVSLIAFAIASQTAFAESGNDPSATPAQHITPASTGANRSSNRRRRPTAPTNR